MHPIPFSKWSPCGNTTLFFPASVDKKLWALIAQKSLCDTDLCAEQVGFIHEDKRMLSMAGGEFCLNAARAFGALLAMRKNEGKTENSVSTTTIQVSGWPTPVLVRAEGQTPHWRVTATLTLPDTPIEELGEGIVLVRLPGISHLLLDQTSHPWSGREDAIQTFQTLQNKYDLKREACLGCIWWQRNEKKMSIRPLVFVREPHSLIFENSCGSASLALALFSKPAEPLSIRQPSGDTLTLIIQPNENSIHITGPVTLVAQGTYYGADESY
ncbi:MAG: hypothetical protein J5803_04150 [Desulfovibrio sp.]|nr:hypothetical protein [Desulfovibrio sp.]